MRFCILTFFLIFGVLSGIGQGIITGKITDPDGNPISFASVYATSTSEGTMSNESGEFRLELSPDTYTIACDYLGYKSADTTLLVNRMHELNFVLSPQSINLVRVEVSANKEDPAYPIIRMAKKFRKVNGEDGRPHSCDLYLKGSYSLDSMPKEILGVEMFESDSMKDVELEKMGLLYLSETKSKLYRTESEVYEHILSSRVSGQSDMFSFNRGVIVEMSLYDDQIKFPLGTLFNPIGYQNFRHYKYELLSTFTTENGYDVHVIKVMPKNSHSSTVYGKLYIVDKSWHIFGAEFTIPGHASEVKAFDSIRVVQQYAPIKQDGQVQWTKLKSNLELYIKIFGFKASGGFYALYSNYNFGEGRPEFMGKNEIVRIEEKANDYDSLYWNRERPIELTKTEKKDYIVKDSIETVTSSPEYLDSLDKRMNKFKIMNVLTGYRYRKRSKNFNLYISSPVLNFLFNPVQGLNTGMGVFVDKGRFSSFLKANYGFLDHTLRPKLELAYIFDDIKKPRLQLQVGSQLTSINPESIVTLYQNSFMNLFFHRNPLHLVEERYIRLKYDMSIFPGFELMISGESGQKNKVFNRSEYSFFYADEMYVDNNPSIQLEKDLWDRLRIQQSIWRIGVAYNVGMKYSRVGNEIQSYGYSGPSIEVELISGLPLFGGETQFAKMRAEIEYILPEKVIGLTELDFGITTMLNKHTLDIYQLIYPTDNGSYIVGSHHIKNNFLGILPFEKYTDTYMVTGMVYHDFKGAIMNKLPLLRNTELTFAVKGGAMYMDNQDIYHEYTIAINNVGIKLIRLFDVSLSAGFDAGNYRGLTFAIGSNIEFGDRERSVSISF